MAEGVEGEKRGRRNRIRPQNWGYTTYLDRVFGMRCFEDLVRLRVFPDAKDISESYGALQACTHKVDTPPSLQFVYSPRGHAGLVINKLSHRRG